MIKIPARILTDVLTGRKDMNEAYADRQYEIIGPVQDGIKFRYLSEIVEKSHPRLFSVLRKLSGVL